MEHLHVLQEGLLSLYVQQGEISVVFLRCHLNCCCHLPYQKLSTQNKKARVVFTEQKQCSSLLFWPHWKLAKQYDH